MNSKIISILQNQFGYLLKLKVIIIFLLFIALIFSVFAKTTVTVILYQGQSNEMACTFSLDPGESQGSASNPISGTNNSNWNANYSVNGDFHFNCHYVNYDSYRINGDGTYDYTGGWGNTPVRISVSNAPDKPVITSPTVVQKQPNSTFNYLIEATSSLTITYGASGLPSYLSYDPNTHIISGTLTSDSFDFDISAANAGGISEKTVIVNVGNGPRITSPSRFSIEQGRKLKYFITATGTTPITFSVSSNVQSMFSSPNKIESSSFNQNVDDSNLIFTVTGTNQIGSGSQEVTASYKGKIGIYLLNDAGNDTINPGGFSLFPGTKGTASFELSNRDILTVYTDSACTNEFDFQPATMPGESFPSALYLKATAPVNNAIATLKRNDIFSLSESVTFSVDMEGPDISGRIGEGDFVTELNEDDPANLVSNNGAVIELAMNKKDPQSGNLKLELTGGVNNKFCEFFYDRQCTQPAGDPAFSCSIVASPTGIAERLCGGSLFVKPLAPVEEAVATLTYSNATGYTSNDKVHFKINMNSVGVTGYKDLAGTIEVSGVDETAAGADEENPEVYQVSGPFKISVSKGDLGTGNVTLRVSADDTGGEIPARIYTDSTLNTELTSMSVSIDNPSGQLAPLGQGSMDLYVKPLVPTEGLNIEIESSCDGAAPDKLKIKVNMASVGITGYTTIAGTVAIPEVDEENPEIYQVDGPFKIDVDKGELLAGEVTLKVSANGSDTKNAAKFYTDINFTDELTSMSVNIENPSGQLAPLGQGSMTLYVRPLIPTDSLNIDLESSYLSAAPDKLKIKVNMIGVNITGYKGNDPIPEEEEDPSDLIVPVYDAASVAAGTTPGYVKMKLERGTLVSGKIEFSITHDKGNDKAVEVYLDEDLTKPLKDHSVNITSPSGDLKPLGNGQAGSMFLYVKPIAAADKVTATISYEDGSTSSDKFSFKICSECPCTGCVPGDDSHSLGSVNSKFSLSSNSYGKPAGSIYLTSEELSMDIAGPKALQIAPFQGTTVNYTYDPNDSTIVTDIDIDTGVTEVNISFTTTTYGTTKYYTSSTMSFCNAGETTPYRTITITNNHTATDLGGGNYEFTVNSLDISNALTLSSGTDTKTVKYEKVDANTWKLTRNNQITEYLETIVDSTTGNKTETFYVGSMTTPVSKEVNVYKIYPWGDALIQSVNGETTAYEYYDNNSTDGMKIGNLKKVTSPKGDITEYTYGNNGNLLEVNVTKGGHVYKTTYETFSIASVNDGTPTFYAIDPTTGTFDYGTLSDTDVLKLLGTKQVTKEYCDSTLTSHSESINYYEYSAGADQNTVYEDASTTHTTYTEYYSDKTDTVRYGKVKKVVMANGDISLYTYDRSGGQETVTSTQGEPNTGGTAVINGSKTVSVYNENGTLLSSASYAILSSVETQISSQTAITIDDFGRVTKTQYMDGTYSERSYGCCGVDWEIDRTGARTDYIYDSTTKRLTSSERNGITTLYTYDQAGNTLTTTIKGRNNTELTSSSAYNEYGVLTSSTDPMNYTTTYTYSSSSDTVTYPNSTTSITNYYQGAVTSTSGTTVHGATYTSGPNWQKTMPQDITVYTDMMGRQYKTVYADDTYTETFYNSKGQAVKQVSPGGKIILTEYDSLGRVYRSAVDMNLNSVIDGDDEITQYTYSYGTHSSKTVSISTVTRIVNTNSKVLSVSETTLNGLESWTISNGLVTHSLTERLGSGQLKSTVEYPDGSKTITYSTYGLTTKIEKYGLDGTTAENTIDYVYDEFDRLTTVTEKYGTTVINEVVNSNFNANGQPQTVTTNSKATTYVYDNMGRRTSVTLPGSRIVTYTYKNTGELDTVDGADTYKQAYAYDTQGRMSTLTTYKDASTPQVTTWNYNDRGFMTSKVYADSKGTGYTYTDDGQLASRTWARTYSGSPLVTSYTYDNAGRQLTVDYSDTTPDITYTYDWMGNISTVADAEGSRTFTYDYTTSGHPGLVSVTIPSILNHSINYTYDGYGRKTGMSLKDGSTPVFTNTYAYNSVTGRMASIGDGNYTANYTWQDGTGFMTQNQITRDSDSAVMTTHNRTYDTRTNNYHLLTTSNTTGATTRTYTYVYNDKDQRTKLTLADGSYWEYSYDDKGQVISGVKKDSAGNSIAGQYFGYNYDGIGNRVYAEDKLAAMKLEYTTNSVNQYTQIDTPGIVPVLGEADADTTVKAVRTDSSSLTGGKQRTIPARSGKYFSGAFTGIDNSTAAQTITYDVYAIKDETTTQQIQTASSSYTVPKKAQTLTYDDDGNMLTDSEGWTYTYNAENRPVTVINADNTEKFEYKYDYMGRRIEEKYYTSSGTWTLSKHLKFVYDGFKKIAEYDGSDNLLKLYTWQPVDLDVPLWIKDGTNYYYYITDGNKNVRSMVDTSGSEVASYDYDPFGNVTASGTYASTNMYRFSSEYYNPTLKSSDYGLRDYSFILARWKTRDPIEENGGLNLYVFVNNSTINYWDTLGSKAYSMEDLRKVHRKFLIKANTITESHPTTSMLLKYYLSNKGRIYYLDPAWLLESHYTKEAIKSNNKRFHEVIKKAAIKLGKGKEKTIYDFFDAMTGPKLSNMEIGDQDIKGSLAGYTITSYGVIKLKRIGNKVEVTGNIEHLAWDYYDFNWNTDPRIPGGGQVSSNELIMLHNAKLAAEFWIYSYFHQSVKGCIMIKERSLWWDSATPALEWGEIKLHKGSKGVVEKIIERNPSAARLKTIPKKRESSLEW